MYTEDQLLPISALQHLLFCARQCALIHVEQVWAENFLTVQGQHLHEKAHFGPHESRSGVRIARGLSLRSLEFGLVGQADIVEFEPPNSSSASKPPSLASVLKDVNRINLQDWRITPVEYKRGRPKKDSSDKVQLCAQAICLEEMLNTTIEYGQLFYGIKRRRTLVEFDSELREQTCNTIVELRGLITKRKTPLARYEPKCDSCSLVELCMPKVIGLNRSAATVFERHLLTTLDETGPLTDDPPTEDAVIS